MTLPFGRHRGRPMTAVPIDYLLWLLRQDWLRDDLRNAVRQELHRRNARDYGTPPRLHLVPTAVVADAARQIISMGFRALSKQVHPDVGGAHETMTAVNAARDYLDAAVLRGVA